MRALLAVGVALAGVSAAHAGVPVPVPVQTGFSTPSRNITCNAGPEHGQYGIVCTVFTEATARGQKLWSMRTGGRVSVGFLMANVATDFPVLRYGRSWSWHGIRCTSRRSGLTCRNGSGHGFVLSRESQRVF